jgi:hypothetical protein
VARANTTFLVTEGPAGSGKTLCRGAYFIPEFLREVRPTEEAPALHISNFPMRVEDWTETKRTLLPEYAEPEAAKALLEAEGAEYLSQLPDEFFKVEKIEHKGLASLCQEKYGVAGDEVRERVYLLADDVMDTWRPPVPGEVDGEGKRVKREASGPWETFADVNLSGCHIAIDEAHNFIPAVGCSAMHKAAWQKWLGEIRHCGATVELLSQDTSKLAKEILQEAGMRISLVNAENTRDPFLRILVSDWLELVAKFITGRYQSWVIEREMLKTHGKWKAQNTRSFAMSPRYFDVYDSYSKPQASGQAGRGVQRAYKRFGYLGLLWWFFTRNWYQTAGGAAVTCFVIWLCFLGGGAWALRGFFNVFNQAGQSIVAQKAAKGDSAGGIQIDRKPPAKAAAKTPGVAPEARDRIAELPPAVQAMVTPELRRELEAAYVRIDELAAQIGTERAGREAAEGELRKAQARLNEAFEVVGISGDSVTFKQGYTYGLGEVIDFGPYEGERVLGIDYEQRAVRLASGRRLRMGTDEKANDAGPTLRERFFPGGVPGEAREVVATNPAEARGAIVPRALRTPGNRAAGVAQGGGPTQAGHALDAGNAPGGVLPMAEQRDGSQHRGRIEPGPAAGDGRPVATDGAGSAPRYR